MRLHIRFTARGRHADVGGGATAGGGEAVEESQVVPVRGARGLIIGAAFGRPREDRHPVAISYTRHDGQASRRTVLPYGIVARSGRWYVTGHESRTGEVRTLRVDRISNPEPLAGSFNVLLDFDATATVLAGLTATPWLHQVSVRVAGTMDEVRLQIPAGLATVEPASPDNAQPWTRVRLRAERLDWVATYLATLDRDMVIEEPDELRTHVRTLGERLLAACAVEYPATADE